MKISNIFVISELFASIDERLDHLTKACVDELEKQGFTR